MDIIEELKKALKERLLKQRVQTGSVIVERDQFCYHVGKGDGFEEVIRLLSEFEKKLRHLDDDEE